MIFLVHVYARRCLVSCLSAMLLSSTTIDYSHSRQLQRQCLRTLGIIITASPPSTFSMLFAQQLPSVLCQCLDRPSSEERGSEALMDSLIRGPRVATEEIMLSSSLGSHLTSFAYCAHTLALLLHTVSSQWGNVPFPLEVVLVPGLLSDFDQLASSSPATSRGGHKREYFGAKEDLEQETDDSTSGESAVNTLLDISESRSGEAMYTTTGNEKVSLRQVTDEKISSLFSMT